MHPNSLPSNNAPPTTFEPYSVLLHVPCRVTSKSGHLAMLDKVLFPACKRMWATRSASSLAISANTCTGAHWMPCARRATSWPHLVWLVSNGCACGPPCGTPAICRCGYQVPGCAATRTSDAVRMFPPMGSGAKTAFICTLGQPLWVDGCAGVRSRATVLVHLFPYFIQQRTLPLKPLSAHFRTGHQILHVPGAGLRPDPVHDHIRAAVQLQ